MFNCLSELERQDCYVLTLYSALPQQHRIENQRGGYLEMELVLIPKVIPVQWR